MKYWVFQNNQVRGPYDPEELARLPGYSAESLVCPEGRKGTNMGDWQRAGLVPALSGALVKAAPPAAKSVSPESAILAGLPPEPAPKDLAALDSLQEKVSLLEKTVAQFQEGLQSKDAELISLHQEIEARKNKEAELHDKLRELMERLSAMAKLRESMDGALAAEQSVESEVKGVESSVHEVESTVQEVKSSVSGVAATVKDMEISIAKQSQAISDLMKEIERIKSERTALSEAKPAPMAEPISLEQSGAAQPALIQLPPPILAEPAKAPPLLKPAPLSVPPPENAEASPLGAAPAPQPAQRPEFSPLDLAIPPALPAAASQKPSTPSDAAPDAARGGGASAPPLQTARERKSSPSATQANRSAATAPPQPPSRRIGVALSLAAFGLAAGGLFVFRAGLVQTGKPAAPADTTPLPPPAPQAELAPQAPSPEDQIEDLKRQAVMLVQGWPTSDQTLTVGRRLEALAPPGGGLSPWMAEKLRDDVFQVNFYGAKPLTGKQVVYEFQAALKDKTVTPLNAPAQALLKGEPAGPSAARVRVKPKKAKTPKPKKPSADEELPLPGYNRRAPAKGADDAKLLDDLLQP